MIFTFSHNTHRGSYGNSVLLKLLGVFLSHNLLEKSYSPLFDNLSITFDRPIKKERKPRIHFYRENYTHVEIDRDIQNPDSVTPELFSGLYHEVYTVVDSLDRHKILGKDFNGAGLVEDLRALEEKIPSSREELDDYMEKLPLLTRECLNREIDRWIEVRKKKPRGRERLISEIRVYDIFPKSYLMPYVFIYTQLFTHYLRRMKFLLPGYSHIYMRIGPDMASAKTFYARNTWHVYTYSGLDKNAYDTADDDKKSRMVFESMCNCLRMIATFDGLDEEKVNKLIAIIRPHGHKTPITDSTKDYKDYLIQVVYTLTGKHWSEGEYFLHVTDKRSGKSAVVTLGSMVSDIFKQNLCAISRKGDTVTVRPKGTMIALMQGKLPVREITLSLGKMEFS